MYGESYDGTGLVDWVAAVQALRYKDFRCVSKPAMISEHVTDGGTERTGLSGGASGLTPTGFHETDSIADFAKQMEARSLTWWWKRAMGYEK